MVETMRTAKKKITNVGVSKSVYESLKKMSYEEINDFIDNDLERCMFKENQEKGCEHFVRIPEMILEDYLESDVDKLIFLMSIHLFNYGNRHNKLKFTKTSIEDNFNVSMPVRELASLIQGQHLFINVEYKRPFFFITSSNNVPSQTGKVQETEKKTETLKTVSLTLEDVVNDFVSAPKETTLKDKIKDFEEHSNKDTLKEIWDDYYKLLDYQSKIKSSLDGDWTIDETYNKLTNRIKELKYKNKIGKEFELPF